jgi:hypothetical protein
VNKPPSKRRSDVASKLEYAEQRKQELMNELFAAKKQQRDPAHIVHTAADILSTVRECFDYLGQDIVESYLLQNSPTLSSQKAAGKLKAYFPFHLPQILGEKSIFKGLFTISPGLYRELQDFARNVNSTGSIPGTMIPFKTILDLKDMVNEKKHDKLIAVVSEEDQEFILENENFGMVVPMKGQYGWSTFSVQPGTVVSRVTEYRFEYNNEEVAGFCFFAISGTRQIISHFHDRFFL